MGEYDGVGRCERICIRTNRAGGVDPEPRAVHADNGATAVRKRRLLQLFWSLPLLIDMYSRATLQISYYSSLGRCCLTELRRLVS